MENQDVQLLKDYSDTEKGAYLGAIASIASADREASEQELKFLAALSESAHLSQESTQAVLSVAKDPKNLSVQRCLDAIKGSDLRFTFIADIMSFAKADGNLSGEEEELIKGMADYLEVNKEQYGVLKQFVETADESARKGEVVQPQAMSSQTSDPEGGFDSMLKKVGIPSNGLMKGVLAIAAPILISKLLMGNRRGGMMGGMGGMGGGLMGGGLLGGLLGSVMGGGMNRGGMGGMGGGMMGGGGLGSVLGGLGGLMGGSRGGMGGGILGGGLGSIMGSVLGGRRARW